MANHAPVILVAGNHGAELETHPESPMATALSRFGGRNDRIEE
jgi:hypothetical protein